MDAARRPPAPAVATAARIIDALARSDGSATLDELTRIVGEPRSSVHRVLTTLLGAHVVDRSERRGGYRLGPKLLDWGSAFIRHLDLRSEFREIARGVVAELNETMLLSVADAPDAVCVAAVDCTRPVRLVSVVGRRSPLHASAAGKVLLASDPALLEAVTKEQTLVALTPNTVTDTHQLLEEVSAAMAAGYALDEQEDAENLCSVAAPVHRLGATPAAVSICVTGSAIPLGYRGRLVACVAQVASELSARSGGNGSAP